MSVKYSFDTSAFIGAWRRRLPPDLIPSFWVKLEALIKQGDVRCIDEVRAELQKKEDEVLDWVKSQKDLVVPLTQDVVVATANIVNAYPVFTRPGKNRDGADPFVIAYAKVTNAAVVTEETASNNPNKPRIPDLCIGLGVRCLGVYDFVREQKWSF